MVLFETFKGAESSDQRVVSSLTHRTECNLRCPRTLQMVDPLIRSENDSCSLPREHATASRIQRLAPIATPLAGRQNQRIVIELRTTGEAPKRRASSSRSPTRLSHESIVGLYRINSEGTAPHLMTPPNHEQARDEAGVATLRGASAVGVGRRFWVVLGALALAAFAIVIVVSFVSAVHDNARIDRLKTHGTAVNAAVDNCIGNLGGSGSNASSYTCSASYSVGGVDYHEVIGQMSSFAAPGTRVAVVADPSQPSTIELASAVATSSPSDGAYLVPGLLSALLVALTMGYMRWVRRARSGRD